MEKYIYLPTPAHLQKFMSKVFNSKLPDIKINQGHEIGMRFISLLNHPIKNPRFEGTRYIFYTNERNTFRECNYEMNEASEKMFLKFVETEFRQTFNHFMITAEINEISYRRAYEMFLQYFEITEEEFQLETLKKRHERKKGDTKQLFAAAMKMLIF